MTRSSVRDYTVLYLDKTRHRGSGATVVGGNAILGSGKHAIDGPSHTGQLDHGALSGLADDDHPQYATNAEFDAHNTRHQSGGADAIKLDDLAAPDDNTDLDASASAHGLLRKLSGVATEYLDGTGAFSTPAGGGGGGGGGGTAFSYIGKNAVGASTENMTGTRMYLKQFTLSAPAVISNIEAYINNSLTASWSLAVAIYSNTAGEPDDLLAVSNVHEVVIGSAHWVGLPIGHYLPAGTYWMGFAMLARNVGSGDLALAYDTSGADRRYDTGYSQQISDIASAPTDTTRDYSIRATKVVASTGGGGSLPAAKAWLTDNDDARDYPGSPNATYDDEFNDESGMSGSGNGLDAKWNWRNQGGASVTYGLDGWGTLVCPAQSSDNWRIIEVAAFADGTYEACVSFEGTNGHGSGKGEHGGLVVVDGTNGDFTVFGVIKNNSSVWLGCQRWTNVTTFGANPAILSWPADMVTPRMFLRVVKAGTSLEFWMSLDGIGYTRLHAETDAVSATRIGFGVNESTNRGLTKLHIDYFRKVA